MTGQSLLVVLVAFTFILSCGSPKESKKAPAERVFEVKTVELNPVDYTLRYETNGYLEAVETTQVKPLVSGKVVRILVEEGSWVKRGDLMLKIEDKDYRALYEEALWNLREAQENYQNQLKVYERRKRLYEKELISKEEFEESQTNLLTLKAKIESLKASLEKRRIDLQRTELKAPFDGYVVRRLVSVGDLVGPSSVCYEVVKPDPLRFVFKVPQEVAPSLKLGSPVHIKLGSGELEAEVEYISPSVDENRLLTVKAKVKNTYGKLKPGMYGVVSFGYKKVKAFLIPEQAVQLFQEQTFLWVVRDSRAVRLPVNVVGHEDGKSAILGQIKEGEKLIVENLMFLKEGVRVKEK
ncbi:membrane fusion protein (multidrug efflux system) [Hydrogenivirga caldilitoris]|uniref:Membrane fusion protein (Multidrug efflux system) n=1 Tax=Hydrogenivirga caldilitoris TaxID=246264 RepID=A0A497XPV0_9AQUI|nr:efflux RND transporter periplasmic adaptor subunit [Hydrogenivirga caldilitoris]RLJ70301.1 membrane fusion protein (multidrug efflux system) [Hydrogenivirga caldilitoris]